jgi:hypothetical protein
MRSPDRLQNVSGLIALPHLNTSSPRHARVLRALAARPLMREELDSVAGASNGPQVIASLRASGWAIRCDRVERTDRDGKPCRPGRYTLAENQRTIAKEMTR